MKENLRRRANVVELLAIRGSFLVYSSLSGPLFSSCLVSLVCHVKRKIDKMMVETVYENGNSLEQQEQLELDQL